MSTPTSSGGEMSNSQLVQQVNNCGFSRGGFQPLEITFTLNAIHLANAFSKLHENSSMII